MQQVSKKGWRTSKREPGDESIVQEAPQLVLRLIEAAYGALPDITRMRNLPSSLWDLGHEQARRNLIRTIV